MNGSDEYHYMIVQIRELLNKHLNFNNGSPESGILWRIQALVHDELEYKNELEEQTTNKEKEEIHLA